MDSITISLRQDQNLYAIIFALFFKGAHISCVDHKAPTIFLKKVIDKSKSNLLIIDEKDYDRVSKSINYSKKTLNPDDLEITDDVNLHLLKKNEGIGQLYVFTSGTTGEPRGVVLEQEQLIHLSEFAENTYQISQSDKILQFTSPGFDVFWEELIPTVLNGASLTVKPSSLTTDIQEFEEFIQKNKISVLNIPTAFWSAWVSQMEYRSSQFLSDLRLVIVGGEVMKGEILVLWHKHMPDNIKIFNAYGPSETTVTSHLSDVTQITSASNVPIGVPVSGIEACVVDEDGNKLAQGSEGELLLSGKGLSPGYLNDIASSKIKFKQDANGKRWFHTGDLVIEDNQGQFIFKGRKDRQIKHLGVRVELNGIEEQLNLIDDISRSCIIFEQGNIIAFLESDKNLELKDVISKIKGILLPQMLPNQIYCFKTLPTTPGGKIDQNFLRNQLLSLNETQKNSTIDNKEIELVTKNTIEGLLNHSIELEDNLFDQGLDSIKAVTLASKLSLATNKNVRVKLLFECSNVKSLISEIKKLPDSTNLDDLNDKDNVFPLSPSQKRMQDLCKLGNNEGEFDTHLKVKISGSLDVKYFEKSWISIINKHSIFRMNFEENESGTFQFYDKSIVNELIFLDLSSKSSDYIDCYFNNEIKAFLDVEKAPFVKSMLVKLSPTEFDLSPKFSATSRMRFPVT